MKGSVAQFGVIMFKSIAALTSAEKAAIRQEILDRVLIARSCSSTVH